MSPGLARIAVTVFMWLSIVPAVAYAQASLTGVVRDASGAVLPGVTVEATSPALIEKGRSAVTDGSGQYRIENLRPGPYVVTFTLSGFSTLRREGVELTGAFTAAVNADLSVGALEESITVSGETPLVDVQSATRQRVLDQEILDLAPVGRNPVYMTALLPSIATERHDVGGIRGLGAAGASSGNVSVHGSSDARMLVNGVSLHSANGGYQSSVSNLAAFQEIAVDTGGVGAEHMDGGVRMSLIPRDGGNTPRGYFLGSFANRSMQGNNFSQDLKDGGLGTPDSIRIMWDLNPAYGGPIRRDKVWYHATIRYNGANSYGPVFYNKHAGNPNVWIYEPDIARGPAKRDNIWRSANARITWQATPKHKVALGFDQAASCECPRSLRANRSPEGDLGQHAYLDPKRFWTGDWTVPVTNRLLFEAAFVKNVTLGKRASENIHFTYEPAPAPRSMVEVQEQSTGLIYRATSTGNQRLLSKTFFWRGSLSYITGAHSFKVGFNHHTGSQERNQLPIDAPVAFRFNNGVPNRITLRSLPDRAVADLDADHGLFVQDRWTARRVTLTLGLRYDYFHDSFPEQRLGPGLLVPARDILFPATDGVRWHDISPRSGVVWDVFGDGTTALKVSLNKYLASQALDGQFGTALGPAELLVGSTTRSWNDVDRNFVPNCDLLSPAANGECGAMADPNFGSPQPGRAYDRDTLRGWGRRQNNWEFSAGVQRAILPHVSLDVSYFRRWFGNLLVTDDRAVGPSDFDEFSITAPLDPRLPGGGGYVIAGLYDIKLAAFGRPSDALVTFADNFGKQIEHWNGVDITLSARPRPGVLLQGGTSTGRRTTDNCEVVAKVDNPSPLYCRQQQNFLTTVKFLASYTIPRIDVQAVGNFQSLPGPETAAEYVASNAQVQPYLGRSLAGGARNVTVNLVAPGTMYGERRNQIDLRVGKILTFAGARVTPSLELYNVLNANPVLSQSTSFANWQQPQEILNARFVKISVQLDF